MERQFIESSMIRSFRYESNSSTLEIEFNSGEVWQYFDFPESLWYEFESSRYVEEQSSCAFYNF